MVVRVAERAGQSAASSVYVAVDDQTVFEACKAHHLNVVMTREDHVSGTDRLAEVIERVGVGDDVIVVNVQGDEPLIDPDLINAVAQTLADMPGCMIATAAHRIHSVADFLNPNVVKVVCDKTGVAQYFSRAPIPFPRDAANALFGNAGADQSLPSTLEARRHIGIYAYRARFLKQYASLQPAPAELAEALEQLRAMHYGHRIAVLDWQREVAAGVDTPEDLARVRAAFR